MREVSRREGGAALLVTVLMMVLMASFALSSFNVIDYDRRVAGYQNRANSALYSAQAGVSEARNLVRNVSGRSNTPAFYTQAVPRQLADSGLYDREVGLPRFYGDPDVAVPIVWIGDSAVPIEGQNLQMNTQKLVGTLWQINVAGESADGSIARLEAVEIKVLSTGY